MRFAVVALVTVLAACDPPSPTLHFRFDDSSVGQCPSANCSDISVSCRKFLGIRIIDPAKPLSPFLDQCDEVPRTDMCGIGGIDLKDQLLPLQDLEVQVAVFPDSMVTKNTAGEWVCPTTTQYDASSGFPIASEQTPAAGGRAFYHPGDENVVVNLGCTDLTPLQACGSADEVPVTAEVVDIYLNSNTFVGPGTVSVGEPVSADPSHVLGPGQLTPLKYDLTAKRWVGELSRVPGSYACLAVLDDAPQSTTSVVCYDPPIKSTRLDWPTAGDTASQVGSGILLSKAALDELLAAQGLTMFPVYGMTIGVVVDSSNNPVSNVRVNATAGTISYFSGDRHALDLGTTTTASGVFVSLDAPFGTVFSATAPTGPALTVARVGGRIAGKVTIVVLRFSSGSST